MKRFAPSCTASLLSGYAREVMRVMGVGHREAVYHRALSACLSNHGHMHRSEVVTPIMFQGECVGSGRADLIIENMVVEIKANAKSPAQASGQLRKYMESLENVEKRGCVGVVLNFNQTTGKVDILVEECMRPQVKRSRFFAAKEEPTPLREARARAEKARMELEKMERMCKNQF